MNVRIAHCLHMHELSKRCRDAGCLLFYNKLCGPVSEGKQTTLLSLQHMCYSNMPHYNVQMQGDPIAVVGMRSHRSVKASEN